MKITIVTGAARGIGAAVTDRLLEAGGGVVAVDLDGPALRERWGGTADVAVHPADVSDLAAAAGVAAAALDRFGWIDGLVNNAGLHARDYNIECMVMGNESWRRLLDVNLLGPLNMCRATARHLSAREGVVVNVSSMSAYAFDPPTAYAVSKAALTALTTCLAVELGRNGVAVVGVAPGLVATDAVATVTSSDARHHYLDNQAIGRLIEPEDMASFIHRILEAGADLVTGHTMLADRGFTRGR
jgi:3-oxoacyl-[acyl-carrier protein] reductase